MGLARMVGSLIVALVFLLSITPLLNFFIVTTFNHYVMDSLMDTQTIQQSWQEAVKVCNELRPENATWTCEEKLANYSTAYGVDLNYTGYTQSGSPFLPFPSGWYSGAFSTSYLVAVVVLAFIFSVIAEAGGLD
jgi:hypothetical protein